jgi:hypothetical protein
VQSTDRCVTVTCSQLCETVKQVIVYPIAAGLNCVMSLELVNGVLLGAHSLVPDVTNVIQRLPEVAAKWRYSGFDVSILGI